MLNNHVAEYREIEDVCLECVGTGKLDFEDAEELLDYADNYQTKDTTKSMVAQFERDGEVDCPECNGKGYIARLV